MVDVEIVERKLVELKSRAEWIAVHRRATAEELAADRIARELVAFNLMLAVQAACDIATHIIADEGWDAADSVSESFTRLAEHQVLTPETALALRRAVGFRNLVAHGYEALNLEMTHAASTSGLADLDRFAREVRAWLATQAAIQKP